MKQRSNVDKYIRLIWQCNDCNDVVVSYSHLRHNIDYCECGNSAVDLEEYYQRNTGNITELSRKQIVDGKWVNI